MASGDRAIECIANMSAGLCTVAGAGVLVAADATSGGAASALGGLLTMLGAGVGFRGLFNRAGATIQAEADKLTGAVRREVYAQLKDYANSENATPASVDAALLALDQLLPQCIPGEAEIAAAGVAPDRVGSYIFMKLAACDRKFEDDPVWRKTAEIISVQTFSRVFAKPETYRALAPYVDAEILNRLGIIMDDVQTVKVNTNEIKENTKEIKALLRDGFDAMCREFGISRADAIDLLGLKDQIAGLGQDMAAFEARVMARFDEMTADQGVSPAKLLREWAALRKSNDVEANKALDLGGEAGLARLDALNEERGRHIDAMENLIAQERFAAARSFRAAAAGHRAYGALAKAIHSYERAYDYAPPDFFALHDLIILYLRAGALDKAAKAATRLETITATPREKSAADILIGDIEARRGDLDAALRAYGRSLEIRERLAADAGDGEAQRDLSVSLNKIGDIEARRGDLNAALTAYGRGLEIRERLAADASDGQAQRDLSVSLNKIGDIEARRGDLAAAIAHYKKSLPIAEMLAARSPDDVQFARGFAYTRARLQFLRDKAAKGG